MNYPGATGRGSSRTGAMHTRFRAHETLNRRPSGAVISPELHSARRPSVPALAQQECAACLFFLRAAQGQSVRIGKGRGEGGVGGSETRGGVCRSCGRRFHRCAIYTSNQTRAPAPIRRLETISVGLLRLQTFELKVWGATLLFGIVE
jgi:hypothetical protein